MVESKRIKKLGAAERERALRILPVFAIEQGSKWRVVWDARALNQHIYLESFKMESAATTARMLRPGDYMFTIDMWSGYHQREKGYA